jgi:hypothetical protein
MAVTDPGSDNPSEQRCQLNDIAMLERMGGLASAQVHRSWKRSTPSWEAAAVEASSPWLRPQTSPGFASWRVPQPVRPGRERSSAGAGLPEQILLEIRSRTGAGFRRRLVKAADVVGNAAAGQANRRSGS